MPEVVTFPKESRDVALDVARGIAVLLMVQTHAFHGWVRAADQASLAFAFTRWLGSFPLPTFLFLSGVAVARRCVRAQGSEGASVASGVAVRGAQLVALGYVTNAAWAWVDGAFTLARLARVDVLHVIGVSLWLAAACVVAWGPPKARQTRWLRAAAGVAVMLVLICPWWTRWTHAWTGWSAYVIGWFGEVRGVSSMPAVPLSAWCAAGLACGLTAPGRSDEDAAVRRWMWLGVAAMLLGALATRWISGLTGQPLSRATVAVWSNAIEGLGRAWLLWSLGQVVTRRGSASLRRLLSRFGVASLWIYVVHVPMCYGRAAGPLRASLSLAQSAPLVLALLVVCAALVPLRLGVVAQMRRLRAA